MTGKYLTLLSIFAIRLSEIEIFDLQFEGRHVRHITIADTSGHFYKRHLNLSDQAAASVRQALHQAAPHIAFGYTPGNQLVYKKRHLKQIEDNLSQLTRASSGGQSSAGEEILFASSSLLIIM